MKIIRFIYSVLVLSLVSSPYILHGQQTPKTNYYGYTYEEDVDCFSNTKPSADDLKLERFITEMLEKIGTKNRITIKSCQSEQNCAATIKDGVPYILYNPEFLKSVKSLNFTTTSIPSNMTNWETITVLAHEIAHHLNYHLVNPHPDATFRSMELEADETAGFILYKLGATLEESQRAMKSSSVSIEGSYTHPPRAQRLDAIRKGWEKAKSANPSPAPSPTPTPTPPPTPAPVANKMTDIDGNQYDVIKIGTTSWAQRNLDVIKFRNGDIIKNAVSDKEWGEAGRNGQPAWCYYNNDSENGKIYGKLYNWYAVNDSRGLCPKGWHLPTDDEWINLTEQLGGTEIAGGKMKSIETKYWDAPNLNDTNESNFTGIPGGYRKNDNSFNNIKNYVFFWSASSYSNKNAWYFCIYNNFSFVYRYNIEKPVGSSVRCIKD